MNMIEARKNKIKDSLNKTKIKRKSQSAVIIKAKLDSDKLNTSTLRILRRIFLEAKWLYNYIINKEFNNDIFNMDYKVNKVPVYVKDHYEIRDLKYLSSQMREEIIDRTMDNIKGLSKLKEKGYKIGKLKFKKYITSIPLKQYNNTYKIINNNYIKIQGIKQKLKVNGLYNLNILEPANALLINKNNNYYIYITAYKNKYILDKPINNQKIVSVDLGIKNQLTLSNGLIINYGIPKSKREKRIQRRLSKKIKNSNNYYKLKNKLNIEQTKTVNRRKDTVNKIAHYLSSNYDIIITQDDNINSWKHLFGKRTESTNMGGIKEALKHKASTFILLDRFLPTTKECSKCHNKYNINLNDRIYKCPNCGFIINRDYNSTLNDLYYGIIKINELLRNKYNKLKRYFNELNLNINVPVDHREFTPVETFTSVPEGINISPYVRISVVNESGSLIALA
ncbi:transposase [Acidiplasma sp. MBA-1]|uniref:RNA-guided endonuclease InsQ/TnpB family protein n=1 Tax=Acidiplasma sp. MBA-1 TaxID=1293648 RepID=UPI000A706880|nr:transposase [Acidiplasma sp. MBA-1]